jgi:ribosomal protein L37AE/L43A
MSKPFFRNNGQLRAVEYINVDQKKYEENYDLIFNSKICPNCNRKLPKDYFADYHHCLKCEKLIAEEAQD